jgi:transposase
MPAVNAEAMAEHLREISANVAAGAHGLVVCDGAGWHQPSVRLHLPDNVSLLKLPPYAPELNPMEIVWAYLRSNKLTNIVWDSYDDILAACAKAWRFLTDDTHRIQTIGYRSWASVKR